jgi:hypothetical protein
VAADDQTDIAIDSALRTRAAIATVPSVAAELACLAELSPDPATKAAFRRASRALFQQPCGRRPRNDRKLLQEIDSLNRRVRDSRISVPFYLKRKGLTETSGLPSVVCFTLNSISFSALVSKTVTDSTPLQVTSRVALSFDFMSIVPPKL